MKVYALLGSELLGKVLIVGALLFATFKTSTVAGVVMIAGYLVYNVAANLIEREKAKVEAEAIGKLLSRYQGEQTGTGGGNC